MTSRSYQFNMTRHRADKTVKKADKKERIMSKVLRIVYRTISTHDIEVCGHCAGSVKVIACIEDQNVIDRILTHLRERGTRPPYPIAPGATLPSTLWAISSVRTTRIHSPKSARTLLKNAWHGLLRAILQE